MKRRVVRNTLHAMFGAPTPNSILLATVLYLKRPVPGTVPDQKRTRVRQAEIGFVAEPVVEQIPDDSAVGGYCHDLVPAGALDFFQNAENAGCRGLLGFASRKSEPDSAR